MYGSDQKTLVAGMNIFTCECGAAAKIPATMDLIARLSVLGSPVEMTGKCTRGHTPKFSVVASNGHPPNLDGLLSIENKR